MSLKDELDDIRERLDSLETYLGFEELEEDEVHDEAEADAEAAKEALEKARVAMRLASDKMYNIHQRLGAYHFAHAYAEEQGLLLEAASVLLGESRGR